MHRRSCRPPVERYTPNVVSLLFGRARHALTRCHCRSSDCFTSDTPKSTRKKKLMGDQKVRRAIFVTFLASTKHGVTPDGFFRTTDTKYRASNCSVPPNLDIMRQEVIDLYLLKAFGISPTFDSLDQARGWASKLWGLPPIATVLELPNLNEEEEERFPIKTPDLTFVEGVIEALKNTEPRESPFHAHLAEVSAACDWRHRC
jgi:hypothetical protein